MVIICHTPLHMFLPSPILLPMHRWYTSEKACWLTVLLTPAWLGQQIFGPDTLLRKFHCTPAQVHHRPHQFLLTPACVPSMRYSSIAHLFKHFELCIAVGKQRAMYLFPGLIQMEPLFGLWEKDLEFTVYSGLHLCCQRDADIFSPSLFTRIQIQPRKAFSDDMEDQQLIL